MEYYTVYRVCSRAIPASLWQRHALCVASNQWLNVRWCRASYYAPTVAVNNFSNTWDSVCRGTRRDIAHAGYIAYRCIAVKADESSQLDFAHDISGSRPCKQEMLNESALQSMSFYSVFAGLDGYQHKTICNDSYSEHSSTEMRTCEK